MKEVKERMKKIYYPVCPNCLSDPELNTVVLLKSAPLNEDEVDGRVLVCPNCGLKVVCAKDTKTKTEPAYKLIYPDGHVEYQNTPIIGIITRRNVRNTKFVDSETGKEYFYAEIQYYGFYLRFAKELFIPCTNCQEELQRIVDTHTIRVTDSSNKIILLRHDLQKSDMQGNVKIAARNMMAFSLRFLRYDPVFAPCYECHRKLQKILERAELIIGNKDYEPMIEFFRKWRPLEEEWVK